MAKNTHGEEREGERGSLEREGGIEDRERERERKSTSRNGDFPSQEERGRAPLATEIFCGEREREERRRKSSPPDGSNFCHEETRGVTRQDREVIDFTRSHVKNKA